MAGVARRVSISQPSWVSHVNAKPPIEAAYRRDLATIHDAGFGHIARGAAATLIERLARRGVRSGTVVELACGSGISSRLLADAGFDVVGFDLSPAMLELARERVPEARFEQRSLYDADLPQCVAVTAIGEAFNYLFDPRAGFDTMTAVVARAHAALDPGGLLLFDFAEPGRATPRLEHHVFDGPGWRVTSEAVEDPARRQLERRITSVLQTSVGRREQFELHRLALYDREDVVAMLVAGGWRPELLASYAAEYRFGLGHAGVIAAKTV